MSVPSHRCWIEVSRSRIAANFHAIRSLVGPEVAICPVVKADAYGHGAVEVSRTLVSAGAQWLAVSGAEEGVALRLSGITAPRILVMADCLAGDRPELVRHNLTPVLHDLADVAPLHAAAIRAGKPLDYHLKIDSGMGRLGTRATANQIAAAAAAAPMARMEGLMTHFASAADYASDQSGQQCSYFDELCRQLPFRPRFRHMASTVAIAYRRTEAWKDMVRPGHGIYGYVSPIVRGAEKAPANQLQVAPALSWKAAVLAVKEVPAGARIGYGAQFTAPAPMRIGILAAGYADGIPHQLRGKGSVIAAGKLVPMIGAISMDVSTVDLTNAPELKPGDTVTLLGTGEGGVKIDAQQIARAAGTISYSVLCGISARVQHVYTD